jgi:hypothetical protein
MNEQACITDLNHFEKDRREWLLTHGGSLDGFTTSHGAIVSEQGGSNEALKAHLKIPVEVEGLILTSENRRLLGEVLNSYDKTSEVMTDDHVVVAREYVERLFGVDLSPVEVLRVPKQIMSPEALGTVYSCGTCSHVLAVPTNSFDPAGVLVRQFAAAAHYMLMRSKPGLAAMMTDNLTQSMVGHYAVLRFATHYPERSSVLRHLQMMVSWEFAKGLSRTPKMPLGFVASDLGEQLMRDYGGGLFKAVMTELYESMTHGQAIWFGSNNFTGMVLALNFLGDDLGIAELMQIDAGDKTLSEKLAMAFPSIEALTLAHCFEEFNPRLARLLPQTLPLPA